MKTILITMALSFSNVGCGLIPEKSSDKPSMSWILSQKQGCHEKVSLRGKGIIYKNCF